MTTEQKAPVMTVKEFLALSDRERNAMVARKVMGQALYMHQYYGMCGRLEPDGPYLNQQGDGRSVNVEVPPYSTDRSAALLAVDHLSSAWWWTIKIPFYPGAHWTAGLCPHNVTGWNGRPDHFASAETFALAICIAALLAVGALIEGNGD